MESWRRQTGDGGRHWARRMRSEIVAPKLYVALLGIVKKSTEDYLLGEGRHQAKQRPDQ